MSGVMQNRPEFVLLTDEAKARGFRSPLAFRRRCQRRAVPIRVDGRKKWVRPVDVDAAVRGLPVSGVAAQARDAVESFLGGARGKAA